MSFPIESLPFAPAVGIGLVVGGAVGLLHFVGLRHTVRLLTSGRGALALASQGLRVAVTALLLAALYRLGLACLLAGFAGFLLARQALLRERTTTGVPPSPRNPAS